MRLFSFSIIVTALIGVGCAHETKKAETAANDTHAEAAKAVEGVKADAKKAAEAAAKTAGDEAKFDCSVKGDERVIEVRSKDKGCELVYTKAGNEGVVASAAHGQEYCKKAAERLRDKLKGAGYDCK